MRYYEQSDSERSRGNRTNDTRKGVFSSVIKGIIRELNDKKAQEREVSRYKIQGNGKYINNGSDDRVNGIEYKGDSYPTIDDQKSYHYGYITHGGRRLLAVVESLIKEGKIDEVALIAERDYNHGLEKGHLGMVENNSVYIEAFDKIATKGKSR